MDPAMHHRSSKHFLKELDIQHSIYSPYYPQGNGLVESMVKISKRLIEKAILEEKPWYALILDYRITPISSRIPSPAEILYGHRLRSNLSLLSSQMMNNRIIWLQEEIARKEGKFEPGEHTPVEDLQPGQPIWYQDLSSKWLTTGTVREKLDEPQSYSINADNEAIYRRNPNSLKPCQTTTESRVVNHSSKDSEMTRHEDSPEASTSDSATTTTSGDAQNAWAQSTSPQKSTSVKGAVTPWSSGKRATFAPPPLTTSTEEWKSSFCNFWVMEMTNHI